MPAVLLFDEPEGSDIASTVVVAGVDRNDGKITELAFESFDDRGDQLAFDSIYFPTSFVPTRLVW